MLRELARSELSTRLERRTGESGRHRARCEILRDRVRLHGGNSGFRILTAGVDGFLTRVQTIQLGAEDSRSAVFHFPRRLHRRLLTDALVRAADRGVRIRVLVDDGDTVPGDDQIAALDAHPSIEVRIFNPFAYRGHVRAIRGLEFLFNAGRLDYRMHNKLLVVDNLSPLSAAATSVTSIFRWIRARNSPMTTYFPRVRSHVSSQPRSMNTGTAGFAIPIKALRELRYEDRRSRPASTSCRAPQPRDAAARIGRPGLRRAHCGRRAIRRNGQWGRLPLIWAPAMVICDSPHKQKVISGAAAGRLMETAVAAAARGVKSELLMVTPYFIPSADERQLLTDLRAHKVKVRVLTNSLESAPGLVAQSGYMKFSCLTLNARN